MTIGRLIELLEQYGLYCKNGRETEIKVYVGMSKQVAEKRLKELTFDDEYVFDDFLDIEFLDTHCGKEGFTFIRAKDIKE